MLLLLFCVGKRLLFNFKSHDQYLKVKSRRLSLVRLEKVIALECSLKMSVNLLKSRCTILGTQTIKNIPKCCYASSAKSGIIDELEVEDVPKYAVEPKFPEEDVDKMRNKSRLNIEHRNILNDQKPYDRSYDPFHDTVWYRKRMLGRYGIDAAGITPAICWPTKADIEDFKEYESLAYPTNLQESIKEIEQRKIDEAAEMRKREEEIDKVVVNFDKWRAALEAKVAKKEAEILAAKQKREQIIAEIREQVGYNVDPRDERFQAILEQKEKEDKKKKKEERKKKKAEKLLHMLQKLNVKTQVKEDQGKSNEKAIPQKNEDGDVEDDKEDNIKTK